MAVKIQVREFVPKPDQYTWTFGGADPVLRVEPGSILKVWTEDAFAGKIKDSNDLPSKVLNFPFVNPQTGPFFVEGAEPGDTLAIHFIDIQAARDWGISTTVPLFGSLTGTKYTATLEKGMPEIVWKYEVDRQRKTLRFNALDSDYKVDLPLELSHGTVGVAPAFLEARNTLVPEAFGGNMDTSEVRKSTTVYLGVNVKGALFSLGDGHYATGEGEVCGCAVEGPMNTVIAIDLIKKTRCEWPKFENDDYIMTAGCYRPVDDAFRIAYKQMVQWISNDYGLSILDAYQLVTQISESPIANMVNPNYTVVAKVPKRFLPRKRTPMQNTHLKLRQLADGYSST